jgi:hypothetical protein
MRDRVGGSLAHASLPSEFDSGIILTPVENGCGHTRAEGAQDNLKGANSFATYSREEVGIIRAGESR